MMPYLFTVVQRDGTYAFPLVRRKEMNTDKTKDLIDKIIQNIALDDVPIDKLLRQTVVLSYQLKNDKLKSWTSSELNGYTSHDQLPEYRKLNSIVHGDLIQPSGIGYWSKQNTQLPTGHLPKNRSEHYTNSLVYQSVSEIEALLDGEKAGDLHIPLSFNEIAEIQKGISNYHIDSAWKVIPKTQVYGMTGKIKTQLLAFLLELNDEIGNFSDISQRENQHEIDKIFNRIMKVQNININVGDHNSNHSTTIDKQINKLSPELRKEINDLVGTFKGIQEILSQKEFKENVESVEIEVVKTEPKISKIKMSLNTIKAMIINIASNASTEPVIKAIEEVVKKIGQ